MREIKFRIPHFDDGGKFDGFLEMEFNPQGKSGWGGSAVTRGKLGEPLQYTGLKDKNGKEVYEKDYDADGNMIDYCERCSGYQFFQIDIPTKDVIFCHNCEGNFMLQDHIHDFEVVGNIYETPQMPNSDKGVQGSDTTKVDSSNLA